MCSCPCCFFCSRCVHFLWFVNINQQTQLASSLRGSYRYQVQIESFRAVLQDPISQWLGDLALPTAPRIPSHIGKPIDDLYGYLGTCMSHTVFSPLQWSKTLPRVPLSPTGWLSQRTTSEGTTSRRRRIANRCWWASSENSWRSDRRRGTRRVRVEDSNLPGAHWEGQSFESVYFDPTTSRRCIAALTTTSNGKR